MNKQKFFLIIIVLLIVLLVAPLLMLVPPLTDTVLPESLVDADSLFSEVNGSRVHYKIAGSGKPTFIPLHSL
jgi:hypothetical protein